MDKQATDATGNKLDAYEIEAAAERSDTLQDLAEFQLAAVSSAWCPGHMYGVFTIPSVDLP